MKNLQETSFLNFTYCCRWNSRVLGSNTETILKKWNLRFGQINLHTFFCSGFSEISPY